MPKPGQLYLARILPSSPLQLKIKPLPLCVELIQTVPCPSSVIPLGAIQTGNLEFTGLLFHPKVTSEIQFFPSTWCGPPPPTLRPAWPGSHWDAVYLLTKPTEILTPV